MSRRESRVSINIRQNDALLEFENCKLMKPAGRNALLTTAQSRNDSCSQTNISQSTHQSLSDHFSCLIRAPLPD